MALTFNKFESFAERLAKGEMNLHTDTLRVYLTNAAPSASADSVKTDLAEISAGNGYTAGGVDVQNTVSSSGGIASIEGVDVVITAAGGDIGPFRYAVLYNDTHASDALIGWWDRGASLTINDTQNITVDFTAAIFSVT